MSFAHGYYSTIGLVAIAENLPTVKATAGDIAPVATKKAPQVGRGRGVEVRILLQS